ncbi:MAG: penicillin-binding protein activator [Rhizobiaceae bacterium]
MKISLQTIRARFLPAAMLCTLAACQQGGVGLPTLQTELKPLPKPTAPQPVAVKRPTLSAKVDGQQVGNGPYRIALLVPTSAQGNAGRIGKELANAARIAVRDFGAGRIQLVVKDTQGQSARAALLAGQARNEGASLVLGPLFSANVSAASSVTKPSNIPMIAFSSDQARAARGVYLMSFAPEADIRRTLNYGLSNGINRVVALLPQGAYGVLAEREMRRVFDSTGGQIVSAVRYSRDVASMTKAAGSAAHAVANANGIYIPDGGQAPAILLKALHRSGANLTGKQIMGSGQWATLNLNQAVLNGAIYAGPDRRNFESFARRYNATYGKQPTINAANAYDAVSLAAELVRRNEQAPFTATAIQSSGGFNGVTGIFRFKASGRLQRGLVINRIEHGRTVIVSPSPTSFGG